jgi:GST-like protein
MINLHTVATANGYKASIMLEEVGLPYTVREYDLVKGENLTSEFLSLNPVGRLPAIVDHDVHETSAGKPLSVYGSAAILLYLAEKTDQLVPRTAWARAKTIEWIGIVSGDVGPAYSGQFVFNIVAPEKIPYAIELYNRLCLRMVATLEQQLAKTHYLVGDEYTIADIIAYPVATVSMQRFPGNLDAHPNLARWAAEVGSRPAVQRGMKVPH